MKKKITLLKVFLTLCLLIVSFSNAWGEDKTWSYVVTDATPTLSDGNPVTVNGATWSIVMGVKVGSPSANGSPAKYSGTYGWKWGSSKSAYWKSYTLSTDYFTDKKVKSVTVNFLNNGSKEGTMTVTQGSTTIGIASATFGTVWTNLTAETTTGSGGTLSINYAVEQASYIHSISVTYEEAPSKKLTSIAVKTAPSKTTYFVGENFDPAGLVITATYDTGDPEDIAYAGNESKFTFNPSLETALAIANDKVTITYGGKTADQGITVNPVVLTSVVVSGEPTKTEYFVGESFNPAGLVVTGHYNNGSQTTITEGITWAVTPETFTETTQTSVSVTATVSEVTSGAYEVTGLTITSPASAYTLTAEPAEGGSYTVTVGDDPAVEVTTEAKQIMVTEGTDIVVEATANEHYKVHSTPFEGKYADETPITFATTGVAKKKQFTYGTADATITAKFLQMYAVIIDENIEHGTVVADPVENTPTSGITLTLKPAAHYHFESVTVKDKNGDDITLEEGPTTTEGITIAKFRMPAAEATKGDVNVTATFAEDAKYAVTFSIIGRLESKSNYAGEQVEFPEVSNVGDYTFMGWTDAPIIGTQQTAPEYVTSATYPEHNNTLYYAVFAEKAGSENYVKVTSVTDGQYLIVNEASSRAFNGLDEASDYVEVEIENDEIADPKGAAIVEIAAMDGDYSLKITNGNNAGKYIYGKSNNNSIQFGATAVANEISFSNGAATILSNSTSFRYNAASGNDRFRYYKTSTTGASYILPALYKKQEATFSNYCTTVSGQTVPVTINDIGKSEGNASFCSTVDLDFSKTDDVKAYIAVRADNDKLILNRRYKIPAGTGIFVLGTGGTYDIPTTTEKCDDVSENKLTGTIVPYTVQDEDNVWALSKTDGKLYHIPSGRTIGAGKAYLNEPLAAASLSLFIVDEPTGVEEIKSQSTVNGQQSTAIFNLQGMRVMTPKKGEVYIMNGKKFLMK